MTTKFLSPGQIITFYSYKGGTGRSMALANVACLLARDLYKFRKTNDATTPDGVLMIDWDLEAPGLHRFFEDKIHYTDFRDRSFFQSQIGLIDLFYDMNERSKGISDGIPDDFFDRLNLERYLVKTEIPLLSLMTAGKFDGRYSTRVNEFDWAQFFESCPSLIPHFAEYLSRKFNYVLIDSRTGYSDISGICTSLLPEKLVVVFTPNRQSLTGVIDLVRKSTEYRKQSDDLRRLVVFPLPSRIEPAEPDLRKDWRFGNTNSSGGVLLVTATKVETKAILDVFNTDKKWSREHIGTKTYYRLGEFGGVDVSLVQSEMGSGTPGGSLQTVTEAISNIKPTDIILVGLAFGANPKKQKLGDILVSTQIKAYEIQKIDKRNPIPRGDSITTSTNLLDKFRSGDIDWDGPTVHFGQILSGENIFTDQEFHNELMRLEPEAIGGEMEGAGLSTAAINAGIGWILVKGISDWATGSKIDNYQQKAAENAARFVLHVLKLGGSRQTKRLLDGYQPEFESVFKEVYQLSDCNLAEYFDDVQIQHVPRYSYGEEIAVLDESGTDRLSLARSFENFTQLLTELDGPWAKSREYESKQNKYDVFLSYAFSDRVNAKKLSTYLTQKSLKVFMAEKELTPGMNWESAIKDALSSSKLLCILVTQNSLKSEWVTTEWAAAWALGKPILPVVLNVPISFLPERLKDYQAINFSEMSKVGNYISNAIDE